MVWYGTVCVEILEFNRRSTSVLSSLQQHRCVLRWVEKRLRLTNHPPHCFYFVYYNIIQCILINIYSIIYCILWYHTIHYIDNILYHTAYTLGREERKKSLLWMAITVPRHFFFFFFFFFFFLRTSSARARGGGGGALPDFFFFFFSLFSRPRAGLATV